MSKQTRKKSDPVPTPGPAKANGFDWKIRPEPVATPRDRRWLIASIAALAVWFAVLSWLAFR